MMLLVLFASLCAYAQATWGAISGFVTDQSGAAIPQAKINVLNEKTGVQVDGTTENSGLYNITHLDPGVYKVTVEATGFRRFVQEHITLQVDSTVRVDPKLTIGELAQEISVVGTTAGLKTEKTDVDRVITQHELDNIPLPNHNVTLLYLTVPGVVPSFLQIGTNENPSEGYLATTNGQLWSANDYQMDGISNMAWGWSGLQIIVPPEDSVQELKVTTSNFDPEYGSVGGMAAQYVTKSGTNTLHGSAYWFIKNSATSAANPFTEKIAGTGTAGKGIGPAPFNENVGGVSLGGPIVKNKMFLFGDYRLDRRLNGANILSTVPNDAFRNGDFSAYATTHPIYDPTTGNSDGTGRQQFSCNGVLNVICPSRIDPVALNLLKLLPRANVNQNTDQNFLGSGKATFNTDQVDGRYDWNISERDKFFLRYSRMASTLYSPSIFGTEGGGAAISGSAATSISTNHLVSLNFTHTFSSSLLSEFRGGLSRLKLDSYQNDSDLRTSEKVGIPNINTGDQLTGGLSPISVSGPNGGFSMGISGSIPRLDRSTMFQFVNNWTKVSGNHQWRWGVDIRRHREDLFTLNASTRGQFGFNQTTTGAPNVSGSGLGTATFLLGDVTSLSRGVFILFPAERATRAALYAGDTWRVTPKLTLNYGIRWEYIEPVVAAKPGGAVNFDFATGDLVLAGLGDVSISSNVKPRYNNFAPRLGIAYRLTEKTVIRAGLGRSYFLNGFDAAFNHLTTSYPIAQNQVLSQVNQYTPIFQIEKGPPTPTPPAFPASGHLKPPPGTAIKAWEYERKTPSVDSWNFTIERQVAHDLTMSVAYVGNKGTHLDFDYFNYNAAPPGPGDLLSRRPFYQKFGIDGTIYLVCDCDDSNYNSLQFTTVKRFSGAYSLNSSFTWAKALDHQIGNRGAQAANPYDRAASYGISYMNRAVVWTLTHTAQVPYGVGRRWGSNAKGFMQAALGGWKFDGVTTMESGLALSPTDSDTRTLNADFGQRPNVVPGVSVYPTDHSRFQWFNPAAFSTPAVCCVWGNAGVGIMRGPGLANADWSFGKEFTFKTPLNADTTRMEFRWENFNTFNHANLGGPVVDTNNPLFGRISSLNGTMRRMQFVLHLRF
jgi:hypothetical protein